MQEHLSRDFPSEKISEELDRLANEGWVLVNCWPAKKGLVSCVLRRERVYFNRQTGSYEPTHPLNKLTAEAALKICLAAPAFRRRGKSGAKFDKSIPLAQLSAEFGANEEEMAQHLREVQRFTPSTTTAECFARVVDEYNLWIHRSAPGKPWILYARKEEPATGEPTAELDGASNFSIDQAIALCEQRPLKPPHQDHSLDLAQAADRQGTSLAAALAAFAKIGLPAVGGYRLYKGRQVLLRRWTKNPKRWFLCVRAQEDSTGNQKQGVDE